MLVAMVEVVRQVIMVVRQVVVHWVLVKMGN
jgi:hypothetical protein